MTKNSRLMNVNAVCSGSHIKLKYFAGTIQTLVAKPGGTDVYNNPNRSTKLFLPTNALFIKT